uniref:Uncharacterized protein n=1 Tax=Arundo donax TaxID=35708 RepID=A0A0A9CSG8_ARUDO
MAGLKLKGLKLHKARFEKGGIVGSLHMLRIIGYSLLPNNLEFPLRTSPDKFPCF